MTLETATNKKDSSGNTVAAKAYETIGCYVTVGANSAVSNTDEYIHVVDEKTSLNTKDAANADNPLVVGKTYDAQAPKLKQLSADKVWTAGTTQIPSSVRAAASTTAGHTNYPCYFYKNLKKLGRKPTDYDITVPIQVGARIYVGAADSAPLSSPVTAASIEKKALKSYSEVLVAAPAAAPTGAYQSIVSFVALIAFAFTMF